MGACRQRLDTSGVKITNSFATQAPWSIKFERHFEDGFSSWCSATITGSNTLMTAAHCLSAKEQHGKLKYVSYAGKKSQLFHIHPNYSESGGAHWADIAFVPFEQDITNLLSFRPINIGVPVEGEKIWLFGFGRQDLFDKESVGERRVGCNKINDVYRSSFSFIGVTFAAKEKRNQKDFDCNRRAGTFAGENSSTAPGDSGGTVLSFDGRYILGVISGGDLTENEDYSSNQIAAFHGEETGKFLKMLIVCEQQPCTKFNLKKRQ